MRRNILLAAAFIVLSVLIVNSSRKILTFRGSSQLVGESGEQLNKLKQENEVLRRELEYKKSQEFQESEIRNKLGLAREGEAVVIVPRDDDSQSTTDNRQNNIPNWRKWRDLLLGKD